jgi:hypothetical protein
MSVRRCVGMSATVRRDEKSWRVGEGKDVDQLVKVLCFLAPPAAARG